MLTGAQLHESLCTLAHWATSPSSKHVMPHWRMGASWFSDGNTATRLLGKTPFAHHGEHEIGAAGGLRGYLKRPKTQLQHML